MEFRYGICPESLRRWEAFERISSIQTEHRAEVGSGLLMSFIVDAELQAVEQATAECERGALTPRDKR